MIGVISKVQMSVQGWTFLTNCTGSVVSVTQNAQFSPITVWIGKRNLTSPTGFHFMNRSVTFCAFSHDQDHISSNFTFLTSFAKLPLLEELKLLHALPTQGFLESQWQTQRQTEGQTDRAGERARVWDVSLVARASLSVGG